MNGKKFCLAALFCIFSLGAKSQDTLRSKNYNNIIKVSLLGVIQKARISYERSLNENLSIGITEAYYYNPDYKGHLSEPFIRRYTDGKMAGFYVQGKGSIGRVNSTVHYSSITIMTYAPDGAFLKSKVIHDNETYKTRTLTTAAGSVSMGYQQLIGKNKRWVIDINISLQFATYFKINYSKSYITNGSRDDWDYVNGRINPYVNFTSFYQFINPGSRITSNFFVGYKF